MECMSFSRLFMAVSLILIYVIQKLFGLAHQASPMNLKPILHEDMDVRHLAFEDQLQFIDSDDDYRTDKLLEDIQLDSVSVSYLSMSVLLFELNERQGCLGAANYSVIRTFSAVNVGQMVLQIRGFKIGSSSSASNILRGRLYNIAKSKTQHQQSSNTQKHNQHQHYYNQQQQQHQQQQQQHQHLPQSQQSICQGYGFTIYDCEPFDLEPNREHKIRIAFNPDFTLTKTIVSLTILTNLDEEFRFALVASIPRNLLATCNQSLPRPDWEPAMHLILAVGMIIMILVSILTAYMEAILYLRSQQSTPAQLISGHSVSQSNHHNGGKDYERTNCSNHSTDSCNKDRSNGSGHGASAISASISSHQHQSAHSLPFHALSNGSGKNNSININKNTSNNSSNNNTGKANNYAQKKRKNSSTANNEKVPTSNKSIGSTTSDKKSSSPYAPIFQNLTNVIASPPPPLPTFDNEFDSLELKKLRGKKSAKKSNSLNGSIASSDDVGNHSSLNQTQATSSNQGATKAKANGKTNGLKMSGSNSTNGERDGELQGQLDHQGGSRAGSQNRKGSLKDVFSSASLMDEETCQMDKIKLYKGVKADRGQQEQATVMPIQPPSSSLSSTPSSSSSSSAVSTTSSSSASSSSSSSSTSSSPPLSASSYGEYSLLGPGATFELPCLRVRSAQI